MTEEENKEEVEDGNLSNDKPTPEKKQEPKPMHTDINPPPPKPVSTAPKLPTRPPETTSGIDVTANMDSEQKERFENIKKKQEQSPKATDARAVFREQRRKMKERRAARKCRG